MIDQLMVVVVHCYGYVVEVVVLVYVVPGSKYANAGTAIIIIQSLYLTSHSRCEMSARSELIFKRGVVYGNVEWQEGVAVLI